MESGFKFRSPGSKIQLWTATPLPLVEYTSNLCFHSHVDIHPVLLSHGPFGGNKLTSQWTGHMVSLQRSQDWLAFFLSFMMCEPAGLTITSGPSISCSLPGLLLLGNSFKASGFSSNISLFWKPFPIKHPDSVLSQHPEQISNRSIYCTALSCLEDVSVIPLRCMFHEDGASVLPHPVIQPTCFPCSSSTQ